MHHYLHIKYRRNSNELLEYLRLLKLVFQFIKYQCWCLEHKKVKVSECFCF